jgi:hypothetical protein
MLREDTGGSVSTERRYTIDGVTYRSLDEMPSSVRRRWDSLASLMRAADVADLPSADAPDVEPTRARAPNAVAGVIIALAITSLRSCRC